MKLLQKIKATFRLTKSHDIARRYFVVNGFDGALTMLGLIMGFLFSDVVSTTVILNACLGAAIALGMSGVSSAYVSESAERNRELSKLEGAMIRDLHDSAHGDAARNVPWLIALVNGSAPLIISLLILLPFFISKAGILFPVSPLYFAIGIAFFLIFLLGVFLGRISGISWLRSGLQTLLIATITALLIYLFTEN
ncbi:MAG: VIT1/CCC1 transporter family protein [Gammaproteobacteria bacterium]|nr:VIT1/CCC1 transporter family protein [Gammaproteobacteria bacterium]MCW8986215.1 VIT1/CCC1 transporter family protein [Gammaproteobacteria bacterium]MCW9031923.1 VIT1/CCC1 transporter family protein [Gammaproteobacteria bacterium]